MMASFLGFPRPDGGVGIRNHVAVIAAMDNVNPVARRICEQVAGTVPVCVAYGRGQYGADLEQHDRVLINYGCHPNVAAVLIIGLEAKTASRLAAEIAKSGRPVDWIDVQGSGGTVLTVAKGVQLALELVVNASELIRQPYPISDLCIGVECGASDATSGLTANVVTGLVSDWLVEQDGTVILSETDEIVGAEHLLAERAASPQVAQELLGAVEKLEALSDFQGLQLWPLGEDNIAGGLTTVEEKSLGAIRKGGTSALNEVVSYGVIPSKKGLVFMDAPAPGVENICAIAAGGAHLIVFNTGVGNPVGHALCPTIKVTGNSHTAQVFKDNIDIDVSAILTDGLTLELAAQQVRETLVKVANGRVTKSEVLGDTEISISRIELGFFNHMSKTKQA